MTHRCLKAADKSLAPKNTRLSYAFDILAGNARLIVATEKIDSVRRGKPVKIMASYCPFCGVKL